MTTKVALHICESDLEMAIDHLLNDPFSYANSLPRITAKAKLLENITECLKIELSNDYKPHMTFRVGSSIWAHIVHAGHDLANYEPRDIEYQIVLSVRTALTIPTQFTRVDSSNSISA